MKTDGVEAAIALANALNRMGFDVEGFTEQLCHHEHRTIQQNVMRAFWEVIQVWAQDRKNGWFDMRNEDTVRFAEFIVKCVREREAKDRIALFFRSI